MFGLLLNAGCALYPQTHSLLDAPPENLPTRGRIEGVPFFPQTDYQCGPSALATVLNFYGRSITPETLSHRIYVPGRKGSLQVEIVSAARQFGLAVYPLDPSLAQLLSEIEAGHPVLVLQNLGFSWLPQWHYATLIGFDLGEKNVILHSGRDEALPVLLTTFERTWEGGEYWGIVISPPAVIPATATPDRYLQSLEDLVITGQETAARDGYLAARKRWPHHSRVAFGQGNLAYRMGDYPQAVESLEAATTMNPDDAASWNNLAYALAQSGSADALGALDKALQLGGNRPEIQSSVKDIEHLLNQSSNAARNALGETPVR